ncbi:MAG: TniB family NTP-binding protein [Lachnospiraceae bacterium]|nr:TniB family NTP-binding protein [Lachnospiraceae bacterium]
MIDYKDILSSLPKMLSGEELASAMAILPDYDSNIRTENQAIRLIELQELYRIYVPSKMSIEIYSKLYLAMLRSLQKKATKIAVRQQYENHKAIQCQDYEGLIGGSDSFTIIGASGIGKTSTISRAVSLISDNYIIEIEKPYVKIIPCVVVQCPYDASVKQMLLEILRKVDEILGSDYYNNAIRARATVDMLIGSVSQVSLNHIGLLVVDEIQNLVSSKQGRNLIGALTQLINNSGISICMVGMPECMPFFESAMHLARRSLGLQYNPLEYGKEFQGICEILYTYQYVQHSSILTEEVMYWLYEHSAGIISIVVSLIHDAQEISILTGSEVLNLNTLNEAYQKRLSLMHEYLEPTITRKPQSSKAKKATAASKTTAADSEISKECISISDLVQKAKSENEDIVQILRGYYTVEEVAL